MQRLPWLMLLVLTAVGVSLSAAPLSAATKGQAPAAAKSNAPLTFEKHIRPIFKVHCVHCHGEASEHEGGLDLRLRRLMVAGGDSGPAIVPGKVADSLLLERIASGEMPPKGKKVSPAEIATIRRWIDEGAKTARPEPVELTDDATITAEDREHWAFQPIQSPAVPQVKSPRVNTPVDAFLLATLEAQGLTFSPEVDRRVLIRRAYFDLLGLPPTPAEVESFVADKTPDAYEQLLDRLLARPEYGERWGRHWLDIAGYADSDGYTPEDSVREYAYKYRDYVIRSFNADKPLDEFIQEQLAGDEMIDGATKNFTPEQIEKLVATGFLRMAPDGTAIGTVDQSVARNQVVADTIKIVSSSLLGLTVGCAECHDHKYDPIPQTDYYRFRAVFEPALDWKTWRVPRARLVSLATDADQKVSAQLEAEAVVIEKERTKLQGEFIEKTFDAELKKLPTELHASLSEAFHAPLAKRTPEQKKLLQAYPSVNVSAGSLYLYDRERQNEVQRIVNRRTAREKELIAKAAEKAVMDAPADKQAGLRAARAVLLAKRTPEQKTLLKDYAGVLVDAASLAKFDPDGAKELAELAVAIEKQREEIPTPRLKKLAETMADIRAKKPRTDFIHALTEVPGKIPATYVFYRGLFSQPKQAVTPGEPRILASIFPVDIAPKDAKLPTSGRRSALAKQLTDPKHPLTSRVLVNRVWLLHFGRGIVATPSDFGVLGEPPSHPQLLDWLARDFTTNGWKLKRLHKLLMTSAAYRQSSARRSELDAIDPDNRLLARMNVHRAEAEAIRDSILAVSGKLTAKPFGSPVPVMPDEVGQVVIGVDTRDSAGRPSGKTVSLGDSVYRRSVYVQVRRTMPLGMLETFDAPTMTTTCNCESRSNSTVAPQSLILMNSEFLIEQAGFFADRLTCEASDPAARIGLAWQLAFARPPRPDEKQVALAFLDEQTAAFTASKEFAAAKPARVAKTGDAVVKPTVKEPVDAALRQALSNLCQALLSSNEFLYID